MFEDIVTTLNIHRLHVEVEDYNVAGYSCSTYGYPVYVRRDCEWTGKTIKEHTAHVAEEIQELVGTGA
jgi:hypothetical protein